MSTQKEAKIIDPATRYSDIIEGLRDVEQYLWQMSRELNRVQKSTDVVVGIAPLSFMGSHGHL